MVKNEIRQLYNTRRRELQPPELNSKAAALLEQFTRLRLQKKVVKLEKDAKPTKAAKGGMEVHPSLAAKEGGEAKEGCDANELREVNEGWQTNEGRERRHDVLPSASLQKDTPAEQPVIRTLLSYFPLLHRGEFDVDTCRQWLKSRYPDLHTALPRMVAGTPQMEAVLVNEQTALVNNIWGIAEPAEGPVIDPSQIDMVFVPLLAFDRSGFRVGYGKGYYDRYLPRCRPDVLKIGFSFFGPVKQIDDLDEFDVPLNYCITPTRVYEF